MNLARVIINLNGQNKSKTQSAPFKITLNWRNKIDKPDL
jgi:hypothetical protein